MGRTYAIADLHGRFDLLKDAIDLVEKDAGKAGGTLVVLGDFVDRGPQSKQIIDRLIVGPKSPNWRWVVLQGNHEAMMLSALTDPERYLRWWISNGGATTLDSYTCDSADLSPSESRMQVPKRHLEWLNALPHYYEDAWRIYVHAGVPAFQRIETADRNLLQWMMYADENREKQVGAHQDLPHVSGKHIVHGHHQSPGHPLLKGHRTNLDCQAWQTGRLAIGVFEAGISPPVRVLEAGESSARAGASPNFSFS